MQKKRLKKKPKLNLKLKFGDYGIFFIDEGRLEFVQLNFIKKAVKIILKCSKHSYINYKKVWYNIVANHVIQCKSKNSRMGKGKGLFERRIIRVTKNTMLFEFLGLPYLKLKFLVKKINKKLGIKTSLYFNKYNFFKKIYKKNYQLIYYNKYFQYN